VIYQDYKTGIPGITTREYKIIADGQQTQAILKVTDHGVSFEVNGEYATPAEWLIAVEVVQYEMRRDLMRHTAADGDTIAE
jgi:hypothetical protein